MKMRNVEQINHTSLYPRRARGLMRAGAVALCLLALVGPAAYAQRGQPPKFPMQGGDLNQPLNSPDTPERRLLRQVAFDQKLNEQVPLDLTFRDEEGNSVELNQYFGRRPIVLTLVQYECPMLCNEILNGLLYSLDELKFDAGDEFDVVIASLDPRETPSLAAEKKGKYVRRYAREGAAEGWHFLTGDEDAIARLADSIGYRFVYDTEKNQYAHPSGVVVLTPTGKISRYFYGVQYDSGDLRLGLVEASANKIGSPIDRILLYCYHYDPTTGKYGLMIMNLIRVAGALTVLGLLALILIMLRRERGKKSHSGEPGFSVGG